MMITIPQGRVTAAEGPTDGNLQEWKQPQPQPQNSKLSRKEQLRESIKPALSIEFDTRQEYTTSRVTVITRSIFCAPCNTGITRTQDMTSS